MNMAVQRVLCGCNGNKVSVVPQSDTFSVQTEVVVVTK